MDVTCIGLAVMDIIACPVSKEDFEDDTNYLDTLQYQSGGDALNAALNMAALGMEVSLIGRAGDDPAGRSLLETARQGRVKTSGFILDKEYATSTSIVMVDKKGGRRFAYYGKCNDHLSVADIDVSQFKTGGIVHVGSAMALGSLDGRGLAELFEKAKDRGCTTSLDVTWDRERRWLPKIEAALNYTDLFLPSLYEARFITKKETPGEIAEFFSGYGISNLVIKMGNRGCYLTDFKEAEILPPAPGSVVVDTTGAGDAFVSGFLFGTKNNLTLRGCAILGGMVASEAIGAFGATTGVRGKFFGRPGETKKILQKAIEMQ